MPVLGTRTPGKGVMSRPAATSPASTGNGPMPTPSPSTIAWRVTKKWSKIRRLHGHMRLACVVEPICPIARPFLAGEQGVTQQIFRFSNRPSGEQLRAHHERVGLVQEADRTMLRPGLLLGLSTPHRDIEPAAQFVVQCGCRCYSHFDFRAHRMEALQVGYQPTHCKRARRADA